jgi:uridine kinase
VRTPGIGTFVRGPSKAPALGAWPRATPGALPASRTGEALKARIRKAELIAIDGLPSSGKSTLADHLAMELGLDVLGLDDFYLPQSLWPRDIAPGIPFPFFRLEQFQQALHALKRDGRCAYFPYDWHSGRISGTARELRRRGPLIVEGCSVLHPSMDQGYDLRLFVASDRATVMTARQIREGDADGGNWERLFLPSIDLYMATMPERRADIVLSGRGAD